MKPAFGMTADHFNTSYAPLCVLGQALWERGDLAFLRDFAAISMKTCDHRLGDKLLDAFLLILAGYPSLYLLNTKLRPDPVLAQAWHRPTFADQSMVSRALDAFTPAGLSELHTANTTYWRQHSQLAAHDWRTPVVIDLDLTPLPASKHAEASTKGYLGKKTKPGANWPAC